MQEFVIEQTALDTFRFIYTAQKPLTVKQQDAIKKATATYLEEGLNVDFIKVTTMDRSDRGKLKQFTSKV